jgi:L-amino acid N-acyltransferase YncA
LEEIMQSESATAMSLDEACRGDAVFSGIRWNNALANLGLTMQQARDSELRVRPALPDDAEQIAAIYNHYVKTSIITFEEADVAASEMANRISEIHSTPLPWLGAVRGDRIVGYAYAGKWKMRAAYRFSTEVTVYVHPGMGGTGIGSALYSQLLSALKSGGVHAVMGGIALPNDASVRLHEKFGFKKVAHFKEVGFKFDRWIDVAYWQLTL